MCISKYRKKKECVFDIPKLKLNRNDDLELREKLLRMTTAEKERL